MVKKEYITPTLDVVEMECGPILSGSIGVGVGSDKEYGSTQDTKKQNDFMKHTWE